MTTRTWLLASALLLMRLSLKVLGFRRCLAFAGRGFRLFGRPQIAPRVPASSDCAKALAAELAGADQRLSIAPDDCLSTSMLLLGLLRRQGVAATFHMGVRTLTGTFESHAWVELDGTVINDSDDVATLYEPMPLPTRG